jgi:nucleoside-diphosphate kinase
LNAFKAAAARGEVAVEILAGGVGSRMPMNQYPEMIRGDVETAFHLVRNDQAHSLIRDLPFGERDELIMSLQVSEDEYTRSSRVMDQPEFMTKGLVPAQKIDGRWYTFLGLHLYNHYRTLKALGLSPDKMPAIVALGASNEASVKDFMKMAGYTDNLDVMTYVGAPGQRVKATVADVDKILAEIVGKYVKEVDNAVTSGYRKVGAAMDADAVLEIAREVNRRRQAIRDYVSALKEVKHRLQNDALTIDQLRWLTAKGKMLLEGLEVTQTNDGEAIWKKLQDIEMQVPTEARRMAEVVGPPTKSDKLMEDLESAAQALAKRPLLEDQIADVYEFRKDSEKNAGQVLPISAPRGHGGILHNMFLDHRNEELLLQLVRRGIKYVFMRNIDNTAARMDEDWMVLAGYTISNQLDMLMEVSPRPAGQKGGTLITHEDRPGQPMQNAEDPSLKGTSVDSKKAPYINNAVAWMAVVDYLSKVYQTSEAELKEIAAIKEPHLRRDRLKAIAAQGYRRYPISPIPKLVKVENPNHPLNGKWVVGTIFETMMWESTGVDPKLAVKAVEVGSVEDVRNYLRQKLGLAPNAEVTNKMIEDYIARIKGTPEYDAFLQEVRWVRFAPNKGWDDYVGINEEIAKIQMPGIMTEDLIPSDKARSEMRAEGQKAVEEELPLTPDEKVLGPFYAAGKLVQKPVQGNIRATRKGEIPSVRSFTPQERTKYLNAFKAAAARGEVAVEILAGGVGSRMPMNQYPEMIRDDVENAFRLVKKEQTTSVIKDFKFGERDELIMSLQVSEDEYTRSGRVMDMPEFMTKGLVPAQKIDGRWYTFLGLHLYNHYRTLKALGLSPDKMPAIVALGASNEASVKDFMKMAEYTDNLDVLTYVGAPGQRVKATVADVDKILAEIVVKYVKDVDSPITSSYRQVGTVLDAEAILEIAREVNRRRQAIRDYVSALKEVKHRLQNESLSVSDLNWLRAKQELLLGKINECKAGDGASIWRILQEIEAQMPVKASDEAQKTGPYLPIANIIERLENAAQGLAKLPLMEDQIADVYEFRKDAEKNAGQVLPIAAPRGHGGILHNMFLDHRNEELLLQLVRRGIKYVFMRNIDNTAARMDEDWMVLAGYTISNQLDMLMEVSPRPAGQKGGTLITHEDRPGQPMQNAEDPSLKGTSVDSKKAPYINNAVAWMAVVDYLSKVYQTSEAELKELAAIKEPHLRRDRLKAIAAQGYRRYPISPIPKLVKVENPNHPLNGKWVVGTIFETMMWESTGVDPKLAVKAVEVGSVEDVRNYLRQKLGLAPNAEVTNKMIEDYIARIKGTPEYDAFLQEVRWVRFAPNKGWDDYVGINEEIAKIQMPGIMKEDLIPSDKARSEMRAEGAQAPRKRLPLSPEETVLAPFYHRGELVQEKVSGKIEATTRDSAGAIDPEKITPEQRQRYLTLAKDAIQRGEVAVELSTGGSGTRWDRRALARVQGMGADIQEAFQLVKNGRAAAIVKGQTFDKKDEMLLALQICFQKAMADKTTFDEPDFMTKGLSPVVKVDGRWFTFLGLYLYNVYQNLAGLGIGKEKLPVVVGLGADNASIMEEFIANSGYGDRLDVITYRGYPAQRVIPTLKDFRKVFGEALTGYKKSGASAITGAWDDQVMAFIQKMEKKQDLSDAEVEQLGKVVTEVILRRDAYIEYVDVMNEILTRLVNEQLTADEKNWLQAKAQLLTMYFEDVQSRNGIQIRELLKSIEQETRRRAEGISGAKSEQKTQAEIAAMLRDVLDLTKWSETAKRNWRNQIELEKKITDFSKFQEYIQQQLARFSETNDPSVLLLPVTAPRGHGGIFHNLWNDSANSEVIKQLRDKKIKYVYFRNIDNTAALLDENWLVELGALIENDLDMVLESSARPKQWVEKGKGLVLDVQKGGTIITHLDREGLPIESAEDNSLGKDSGVVPEQAPLINNAAAWVNVFSYLPKVYGTDTAEIERISALTDEVARRKEWQRILEQGFSKYRLNPEVKEAEVKPGGTDPLAGRYVVGTSFTTNMWESTGTDDSAKPQFKIKTMVWASVQDLRDFARGKQGLAPGVSYTDKQLQDYLYEIRQADGPAYNEFLDIVGRLRFAPNKGIDDFTSINGVILSQHHGPAATQGIRSEMRSRFIEGIKQGKVAFALIKPDAIGEKDQIIKTLEANGFVVHVGEPISFTEKQAEAFYAVHRGKSFYYALVDYLMGKLDGGKAPIPLFLETKDGGTDAIKRLRDLVPQIRGEGPLVEGPRGKVRKNKIHASDSIDNAILETAIAYNARMLPRDFEAAVGAKTAKILSDLLADEAQLKDLPVLTAEISDLGFTGKDGDPLLAQLVALNNSVQEPSWDAKKVVADLLSKKAKGGKLYVAYIMVEGQPVLLGQGLLLGNFDRLDATLNAFQGLGIASKVTQARVEETMKAGYMQYTAYVHADNEAGLALQRAWVKRFGDFIKAERAKYFPKFGGMDLGEPVTVETPAFYPGDESRTPMIRFVHQIISPKAEEQIVGDLVGVYSPTAAELVQLIGYTSMSSLMELDSKDKLALLRDLIPLVRFLEERRVSVYYPEVYRQLMAVKGWQPIFGQLTQILAGERSEADAVVMPKVLEALQKYNARSEVRKIDLQPQFMRAIKAEQVRNVEISPDGKPVFRPFVEVYDNQGKYQGGVILDAKGIVLLVTTIKEQRKEDIQEYETVMREVADRLVDARTPPAEKNWFIAKGELLAENAGKLAAMRGFDIRKLLGKIESEISVRADAIARGERKTDDTTVLAGSLREKVSEIAEFEDVGVSVGVLAATKPGDSFEVRDDYLYVKGTKNIIGAANIVRPEGNVAIGPFLKMHHPALGGKEGRNRTDWEAHDPANCPFCKYIFNNSKEKILGRTLYSEQMPETGGWLTFYQYVSVDEYGHFLWIPYDLETGTPDIRQQKLTEKDIRMLLRIPRNFEKMVAVFNDVGASVNHFHLQSFVVSDPKAELPIENYQSRSVLKTQGGVTTSLVAGFPGVALVYKGTDENELAKIIFQDVMKFYQANIPVEAVVTGQDFYLFPVKRVKVGAFPEIMMGAQQRIGIFAFSQRSFYESLTPEKIIRGIDEGSQSLGTVETILGVRSEMRTFVSAKQQASEVEKQLEVTHARLREAIENPRRDFDLAVVGTHPFSEMETKTAVAQMRESSSSIISPSVPVWTGVAPGRGSLPQAILGVDKALQEQFGVGYAVRDVRAAGINNVFESVMSGYGFRNEAQTGPSAYRNKGLVKIGRETLLRHQFRQRLNHFDKDQPGIHINSVDGIVAAQYPTVPGKAGIKVYAVPVAIDSKKATTHGVIEVADPFKAGAQEILLAREKPSRSMIQDLRRKNRIKDYVLISTADYFVSWEVYDWLLKKIGMLPPAEVPGGQEILRYNWFEHLFEAAFSSWEEFQERYLQPFENKLNRSDFERRKVWLAEVFAAAQEAREKFGIEVVNLGPLSRYYNLNTPADYQDLLEHLRYDSVLQDILQLKPVSKENGHSPDLVSRFEGKFIEPSARIHPNVASTDIGPSAMIIGQTIIMPGSRVEGIVVDSLIQGQKVPEGSMVSNYYAGKGEADFTAGTITTQYVLKSPSTRVEAVRVAMPLDTNLEQKVGERSLREAKVFPRVTVLEGTPLSASEAVDIAKHSLAEMSENVDYDVLQKVKLLLSAASIQTEGQQGADMEAIATQIREMISSGDQKTALQEPEPLLTEPTQDLQKPVSATSGAQVGAPEAEKTAARAEVRAAGAKQAITAAGAAQELRFGTEILPAIVNPRAGAIETRLILAIMDILKIKTKVRDEVKGFGSHIIEYNPAYGFDAKHIAERVKLSPVNSKFTVVAKNSEQKALEAELAALGVKAKEERFELYFSDDVASLLQRLVESEMSRLGIAADSFKTNHDVLQAVVEDGVNLEKLLTASALLNQFVEVVTVTGSRTKLSIAFQFSAAEILGAAIQAEKAIGTSA